jgi:radical SAM superfamily enzyme YgiQ (UPF0313 family)
VIDFLQGGNRPLSYRIATRNFLPENKRFDILKFFDTSSFSTSDLASFISTLYIDDIFDAARKTVIPLFGLSSYGDRLDKSISDFRIIERHVNQTDLITVLIHKILSSHDFSDTKLAAITIPFPGNLLSSMKIAKWLKNKYPKINIVAGGGYVNTELCFLSDTGIFNYFDFLCFGDGELPLLKLSEHVINKKKLSPVRTLMVDGGKTYYVKGPDHKVKSSVPDYKSVELDRYLSLRETTNVMHNLWSEKGFLKLRFAKGCYHHKCAFCDTSLDYIKDYSPSSVDDLINQVTEIMRQTGVNSFHFADEAMPPALVKKFCTALIEKNINIVWWGNVRFEKQFDASLCSLMSRAGCIAVTGGIETANNRILRLMEKGVSVEQIVRTCDNFSNAKILVHGYLICGFPTETATDAVNSLEIIRQMFFHGVLNSAYYHRFTLTVHSPVFKNPEIYSIKMKQWKPEPFANNDVEYDEKNISDIDAIESGLNKALFNYNSGICLDDDVNSWFDKNYEISVPLDFVYNLLKKNVF